MHLFGSVFQAGTVFQGGLLSQSPALSGLRLVSMFRAATAYVLDLLFPRSCAGCGQWDQYVCLSCARELSQRWENVAHMAPFLREVSPHDGRVAPMFACYTLTHYEGVARRIIIEWKHSHSYGLDQRILQLWRKCVWQLCSSFQEKAGVMSEPRIWHLENVCFVPAPSRWQRRYDGRLVAAMLAQEAAQACRAPMRDVLRVRSRAEYSAGDMWQVLRAKVSEIMPWGKAGYSVANFSQRSRKRHNIYAKERLDGVRVILVDDVVTTGATAGGAARAIKKAGGEVLAMIALASVARESDEETESENLLKISCSASHSSHF